MKISIRSTPTLFFSVWIGRAHLFSMSPWRRRRCCCCCCVLDVSFLCHISFFCLGTWRFSFSEKTESSSIYRRILFLFFWRYFTLVLYKTQCLAILYICSCPQNKWGTRERERELEWWILRVCNWHRQRSLQQKSLFLYVHIERRDYNPLFPSSSSSLYITHTYILFFLASFFGCWISSLFHDGTGWTRVQQLSLFFFRIYVPFSFVFFFRGVEGFCSYQNRERITENRNWDHGAN